MNKSLRHCLALLAATWAGHAMFAATPDAGGGKVVTSDIAALNGDYLRTGWDILGAFPFAMPDYDAKAKTGETQTTNQIPEAIKGLDGKKVIVKGFMLPVKMEKGLVTEFLLVATQQACCYGVTPNINEFVVVKMNKGITAVMDTPVEFFGKLQVKEIYDEGYLSNIYTLQADKMGKAGVD